MFWWVLVVLVCTGSDFVGLGSLCLYRFRFVQFWLLCTSTGCCAQVPVVVDKVPVVVDKVPVVVDEYRLLWTSTGCWGWQRAALCMSTLLLTFSSSVDNYFVPDYSYYHQPKYRDESEKPVLFSSSYLALVSFGQSFCRFGLFSCRLGRFWRFGH